MANRSDFLSVFPRFLKKLVIMGRAHNFIEDGEQNNKIKNNLILSHKINKDFTKKQTKLKNRDSNSE